LTTLTSASTARGLAALIDSSKRKNYPCISIGPITTKDAMSLGFSVVAEAKTSSIPALVDAVIHYFSTSH
jgi:uroporphyrinogen-III synthase